MTHGLLPRPFQLAHPLTDLHGSVNLFKVTLTEMGSPAEAGTIPSQKTGSNLSLPTLSVRWIFPSLGTTVTPLDSPRTLFGRGDECDVKLPGSETSRQHAEIRRDGPLFVLRDLGSTNGSFRNGTRVSEAPLSEGDVIRLGEWIGLCAPVADGASPGADYSSFAPGLYGGPSLAPALALARRAAPSDLPVLVEGETGTGKEGLCRALHTWSGRQGPFLAVNCGALPESLAEAELFGYRRGAFTGADRPSLGHFRSAQGGTLLLDEITELSLPLQAKLLRVLEQHEVLPLGESTPVPIDVRLLAATQGPLLQAASAKQFRADLYARLDGVTIRLPPLRKRVEEIPFLFVRLLQEHAGGQAPTPEPKLIEQLCLYDWPFNVREMDLLVRSLLVMHDGQGGLKKAYLPERFRLRGSAEPEPEAPVVRRRGTEEERRARDAKDLSVLLAALRTQNGNVVRAASQAGISRQRAYRLMEIGSGVDLDEMRASANVPADNEEPKSS
jgi:transcriptional regulator with AAA-type ATPase domain